MLDAHPLTPEQQRLLVQFVAAARSVREVPRRLFYLTLRWGMSNHDVEHPGWPSDTTVQLSVVQELERQGLLERRPEARPLYGLVVTQRGYAYVEELERRNSSSSPHDPARTPAMTTDSAVFIYDVALSFAGTERESAEHLATILQENGFRVFYDGFEAGALWGEDLTVRLDEVYRKLSRYCVIFVSREYLERAWPSHERRSAVARLVDEKGRAYILPIKVDAVELPGVPNTIGYLSLDRYPIDEIARILIKKLGEITAAARATRLLATAANDQASRRALVALYRANPADYELFNSTLSQWSEELIRAIASEAPSDLAAILAGLEAHLPKVFPFSYLNTLSRLLGQSYRVSHDRAVRHAALDGLLRIGKRYDEIDMGKEFANLAARAHTPAAMRPIAQALKERPDAIFWAKEYLQRTGTTDRVLDAMEELGVFFADLGDPESEARFHLQGWGEAENPVFVVPSSLGDRTLRYQTLRAGNALTFTNVLDQDYRLTTEILAEECDDSFEIVVGESSVYTFQHTPSRKMSVKRHEVEIPKEFVQDRKLVVTFRNTATDDCGGAGVYYVLLQPHPDQPTS